MFADKKVGKSSSKKPDSNKWKYPKMPIDMIYKMKNYELFPKYKIKDWEETDTATEQTKDMHIYPLNNAKVINLGGEYQFLHLGLIQVAIKPLARAGLGAPIVVCLRDNRHRDFHNSLLAMVELDSTNGPFYFNCSPNLAIPFKDYFVGDLLSLHIKTNEIPLALTYRVVVKSMHNLDNTKALLEYSPGETDYVQANVKNTTKWDEAHVPQSWLKLLADRQEKQEREEANARELFKMVSFSRDGVA